MDPGPPPGGGTRAVPEIGRLPVIITCEQCQTRFQLDEARIPARGARVRCSRCKHAFFVRRPEVPDDEALTEVVAEATDPAARSVPEPSLDLGDGGRAAASEGASESPFGARDSAVGEDGGHEEEDWEFNEEPPTEREVRLAAPGPAPAPEPARAARAPEPPPQTAPTPSPFEELGSPEEWDFLGGLEADGGAGTAPPEPEPADPEPAPPAREDRPAAVREADPQPASGPVPVRRRRARPAAAGLARAVGWMLAVGVFVGTLAALAVQRTPRAPVAGQRTVDLGGVVAHDVRALRIENLHVGGVWVVTGRLEGAAGGAPPGRALRVQLLDANGDRLAGATAWAGPPVGAVAVREWPPERVAEALARGAAELALTGWPGRTTQPFQALLGTLPEGARDYTLEWVAAPAPPAPPSDAEASDPTASSPPSPRPSSG
jgi:predicted Zn finger-like uncharacterized protein